MAFRDSLQTGEVSDYLNSDFFYNLGSSVGYGCPNKPNDVRLVQYFLNVHNGAYDWIFGKKIAVDGAFGGETWGAIKRYQLQIGYNGYGMVSSVKSNNYTSPKTNCFYTIIYLNDGYRQVCDQYWKEPRRDPEFPEELKAHLYGSLPQQT
jgi:hypothetical protein